MADKWAIFETPTGRVCWQLGEITDAQVPAAMTSARQKLGVPANWQNDPAWDFSVSTGVPHPKTLTSGKVYGPDGGMKTAAQVDALVAGLNTTLAGVTGALSSVVAGLGKLL